MGTRKIATLAAALLLAVTACGDDGSDEDGEAAEEPASEAGAAEEGAAGVSVDDLPEDVLPACEVADGEIVADLFEGAEATEELQMDACLYQVSDGLVASVALVHPSPTSDDWLAWRTMVDDWAKQAGEEIPQEIVDLEDLGDEAYTVIYPEMDEMMLVVRSGTRMFRVGSTGSTAPEARAALEEFGRYVVDNIAEG